MNDLPQNQQDVLDYLRELPPDEPSPTIRELMDHFHLAQASIDARLRGLREKGYITWKPGIPRSIRVLRPGRQWVDVPTDRVPLVEAIAKAPDVGEALELLLSSVQRQRKAEAAAKYNGVAPL